MNRLCWRSALLACALFCGGLAPAQPPGYTEASRYSYNPLTGTTTHSRRYSTPKGSTRTTRPTSSRGSLGSACGWPSRGRGSLCR
jgi:hypothetical protein